MKALIRNKGETVRETDGIKGIDWKTGAPLTNPEWCGGPYRLVENYVETEDVIIEANAPVVVHENLDEMLEQIVSGSEEVEDVVLYNFDGKMYTLEELKEKLNKI